MSLLSLTEAKVELLSISESIFSRGLTPGASANISLRFSEGFLVTPTNACLGFLNADTLSILDEQGELVAGDRPSKEFEMHRCFYDAHAHVNAVIHLHSTYATALSCLPNLDKDNVVTPLTPYLLMRLGKVGLIPYCPPGDSALFDQVAKKVPDHTGLLLANHGPIVGAKSLMQAMYAIEELEESCKLQILLQQASPNRIPAAESERLIQNYYGKI